MIIQNMESSNWLKIVVWVLCLLIVGDWAFDLINLSSTIANLVGVALLIGFIWVSSKTKCFTEINFKNRNKNEESN